MPSKDRIIGDIVGSLILIAVLGWLDFGAWALVTMYPEPTGNFYRAVFILAVVLCALVAYCVWKTHSRRWGSIRDDLGIGAIGVSAAISTIVFLLFGVFLPIWAMTLIHGKQNVEDARGHGGIILLVTLPIVGVLCVGGFLFLTPRVYRRISSRRA